MNRGVFAAVVLAALGLTACSSAPGDGGNPLVNLIRFGGVTEPPPLPEVVLEAPCPQVDVITDAAAIRTYAPGRSGQNSGLRSQIAIGSLARECIDTGDGFYSIKVGVEARALIGPAGSPGRFDAPIRFVLRTSSTVHEDRRRSVSVTIPAGQTQGSAILIEENLRIPSSVRGNYIIEVGVAPAGRRG